METDLERLTREDVMGIAMGYTRWQEIIHGSDLRNIRGAIAGLLWDAGKPQKAFTFACCGRSDAVALLDTGEHVLIPHGCGSALCPRCVRKRAFFKLRRIIYRLNNLPHGFLWHVIVTQPAVEGEKRLDGKARLDKPLRRFLARLRRRYSVTAGLTTFHSPVTCRGAWHVHAHLVLESDDDIDASEFQRAWDESHGQPDKYTALFSRKIDDPGDAMRNIPTDPVLWNEPEQPAHRTLSYQLHDMSGILSAKSMANMELAHLRELVDEKRSVMMKTFGKWLRGLTDEEKEDLTKSSAPSETPTRKIIENLGTVDCVLRSALAGVSRSVDAVVALADAAHNKTDVGVGLYQIMQQLGGISPKARRVA